MVVYLDDIVIFSKTLEEHKYHVRMVLEVLATYNFKLNEKKCSFQQNEIEILGHVVSESGVQVDKKKVCAIKNFGRIETRKGLLSF